MRPILTLSFVAIFLLTAGTVGCGSKKPQVVTFESNNTLTTLRSLSSAYENRDADAFMKKISKNFPDRRNFRKTLDKVFSKYASLRFTIHYEKMLIMIKEQRRIEATFNWDVERKTAGGGIVRDGGRVTCILDPQGKTLRSIRGKNPFVSRTGPRK